MKFIQKISLTIGVLLFLIPQIGSAHNQTVSKMVIRMDRTTHKWFAILSYDQVAIIASLENENTFKKQNFRNDILWKKAFIQYAKKHIRIETKDGKVELGKGTVNLSSNFEATLELENMPQNPSYIEVENTCLLDVYPNQVNMTTVIIGKEIFDLILTKNEQKQSIYLNNSFANHQKAFYQFTVEGFRHVLPLGLDHILFILALFFLNSNLKSSIIQASMFTLAHSITLILTGIGYINLDLNSIEPLIAFSIFIMVMQNIFYPQVNHSRLILIFLFGLIHGLGFASAFLNLQIPAKLIINALLAFNIGVELAQISIILAVYFLLSKWFNTKIWYQKYFTKTVSILIGLIAIIYTYQRTILLLNI